MKQLDSLFDGLIVMQTLIIFGTIEHLYHIHNKKKMAYIDETKTVEGTETTNSLVINLPALSLNDVLIVTIAERYTMTGIVGDN